MEIDFFKSFMSFLSLGNEGRRIRTPVGISQQILSLSRLTAPAFPRRIKINVRFKKVLVLRKLDGHSDLVTPDPVPNSEVKLVVFAFVLSLMGRRGAVYLNLRFKRD